MTYRNQYDGMKIFLSLLLLEVNVSTNSSFTKKENEALEAQVSSGTKSMTMDESTLIKFRNNLFEVILYDLLHQVYCCFILYCVPKKALVSS